MDTPRSLMKRIRNSAAHPIPAGAPRVPVPAPIDPAPRIPTPTPDAGPAPDAPAAPVPRPAAPTPCPVPARGHALYSQLMRSHDRMGTRHTPNA